MEIYSRVSNAVRLEWPGSEAGFVYSTCTIYILVGGLRHVRATLLGPGFPSVAEDHLLFLRPWTRHVGKSFVALIVAAAIICSGMLMSAPSLCS